MGLCALQTAEEPEGVPLPERLNVTTVARTAAPSGPTTSNEMPYAQGYRLT